MPLHVSWSHGQSFSRHHCNTFKWPPSAAVAHVLPHANGHLGLLTRMFVHSSYNHFLCTTAIHASDHYVLQQHTYLHATDNHFHSTIAIHASDLDDCERFPLSILDGRCLVTFITFFKTCLYIIKNSTDIVTLWYNTPAGSIAVMIGSVVRFVLHLYPTLSRHQCNRFKRPFCAA